MEIRKKGKSLTRSQLEKWWKNKRNQQERGGRRYKERGDG
jgi:hypothetical protein